MKEKRVPPARIFSYAAGQGFLFHSGSTPRVLLKDVELFSLALLRIVGQKVGSESFIFSRLNIEMLWIGAVNSLT